MEKAPGFIVLQSGAWCTFNVYVLIGLQALDLVPKKAAGTAAGLTGLFGYFGGAFAADIAIGAAVDRFGWDGGFWLLFGSCLASVILFAVVWWKEGSPAD